MGHGKSRDRNKHVMPTLKKRTRFIMFIHELCGVALAVAETVSGQMAIRLSQIFFA